MNLDFTQSNAADLLKENKLDLKLSEAKDLQEKLGRLMTLLEATIFSIQLSEHCSYKSSRQFLKNLPTEGDKVVLGPGEDAGIIEIFEKDGEKYCLAIGHESHNHPSQVVPYEGAATGIGGIVRDILCMGARPCGVLDSLRFGDEKKNLQRNIAAGAVTGIAGYGNPLGVPNEGGDAFFDKGFDENCLVNVTACGSLRESDLIHSFVPQNAAKEKWDLLIVGKPTDNSGFGGASFASGSFEEDDDIDAKKAAVQEPNPFLERHLIASFLDLFKVLKENNTFHQMVVKDLGAGGVVCASVEIVEGAGFGADISLDNLHVAGDFPSHVIACSETQERFCIACHPDLTEDIQKHFNEKWELPRVAENAGISKIGSVRTDDQYVVTYKGEVLCDAPAKLVTEGVLYDREFVIPEIKEERCEVKFEGGELVFS